jgi:hypothetical protein
VARARENKKCCDTNGRKFMQKYDFSIRTRNGQLIERLMILGKDQQDAERKLNQMYHYCEIVRCGSPQQETAKQGQSVSMEDLITLIAR